MTCVDCRTETPTTSFFPSELMERLRRFPKAFWGERIRRATRTRDLEKLRLMSDHMLDDIGLRRSDVGCQFDDISVVRPDLAGFLRN